MVSDQDLDELVCTKEMHSNIFNLNHNPEGELPMFCRCGEVDFNDDETDIDFQKRERWIAISQEIEQ